jgi:hypothetical protein
MSRRWSGVAQAMGLREIEAARQVEAPIGPIWMINVTGTVFKYLHERFESLGTGMTQQRKFKHLDEHFESLGTRMTHQRKFRDR